jgi:hypothetical protein
MVKRSFEQKFWEDKKGRIVIWQKPNIWLIIWFAALVLNWFAPYGIIYKTLGTISLIALVIWSVLEVLSGVNYFRRIIGLLILLILVLIRL